MKKTILISISLLFSLVAMSNPKEYVCQRAHQTINVDGVLDDAEWGKAQWTDYFVDIEGSKQPLPTYKTRAKMLWDDKYIYFAAEIEDPNIWATLTERDAVIFNDPDFEIFIDPNSDNHLYYEFEMNAFNTVWDLLLTKPYRDNGKAIDAWNIRGLKSGTKVYGTINDPKDTDQKWTIEVAMPWEDLEECARHNGKPLNGEQWRIGFSRVNWDIEVVDGKYVKVKDPKTGNPKAEHNWVWSPQGVIAMHQPETWAYVQFSDKTTGEPLDKFNSDVDFSFKMDLMDAYSKQTAFKEKNKKFATDLKLLKAKNKNLKCETTSEQFLISGKAPSGKTWCINEESRIFEK